MQGSESDIDDSEVKLIKEIKKTFLASVNVETFDENYRQAMEFEVSIEEETYDIITATHEPMIETNKYEYQEALKTMHDIVLLMLKLSSNQ